MNYGVGVSNVFDVLEDENEERETSKAKPQRVPAKGPAQTAKKVEGRAEGQKEGRASTQGSRPPRRREGAEKEGEEKENRHQGERGKRGLAPARPGKRVYDRKSGTGRGKEVSKGGAGKGSWGNEQDEIGEGTERPPATTEGEAPKEGEEKKEGEATTEATEEKKEPENVEKTLQEYLEEQKKKTPSLSLPPPRTIAASEEKKWKDFVPMKKDEESGPRKREKKEKEEKEEKETGKGNLASELLQFKNPRPRFERRDNKPSTRGGGGRKEPKGNRSESKPIKVDDEKHFPVLAAKA